MATLSDSDRALIRLYTDDPSGPDEVMHDTDLDALWDLTENVEGATAKVWRIKAAKVSDWFLANVDGAFLSRDQVFAHCITMAEFYETQGGTSGVFSNIALIGPNAADEDESSEF